MKNRLHESDEILVDDAEFTLKKVLISKTYMFLYVLILNRKDKVEKEHLTQSWVGRRGSFRRGDASSRTLSPATNDMNIAVTSGATLTSKTTNDDNDQHYPNRLR